MSWAYEVHGVGDPAGHYVANGLRFSTQAEADAYGRDLGMRWFGFDDGRSAVSTDPVTHAWIRGYGVEAIKPEYNEYVKACTDKMMHAESYISWLQMWEAEHGIDNSQTRPPHAS